MSINTEEFYSVLASKMKASAIREILKLVQNPEVISLAGGLPDPATFPVKEIKEITQNIFATKSAQALQYSTTEGLPRLRQCILDFLAKDGNNGELKNIIISSGWYLCYQKKVFRENGERRTATRYKN